jgi:hypothetical protein
VLHSWFNDEAEDDEAGESDDGQRYEEIFHDVTLPVIGPLPPPGKSTQAPRGR